MKYSIFINPMSQDSSASKQAYKFMQAIREEEYEHISLFFYSYAVECAFFKDSLWKTLIHKDISLIACSTIAQDFQQDNKVVHKNFTITGLGQWMESTFDADKRIEFI